MPTIGLYLVHDRSFFKVDEGKVEQFVSCDVLQQLANNQDGANNTFTRHRAELLFVDIPHIADVGVSYMFPVASWLDLGAWGHNAGPKYGMLTFDQAQS